MENRPYILSIAGFDPSCGAGIAADIKTIEALNGYGLAVQTANTIQTDTDFYSCYWTPIEVVLEQIQQLFKRFTIGYVKIGIVKNWESLHKIINLLKEYNPSICIVVDPVLKASTKYDFHSNHSSLLKGIKPASGNETVDYNREFKRQEQFLDQLLSKISLLTPNYLEIQQLYPEKSIPETLSYISDKTPVLLKGGHREKALGVDVLYLKEKLPVSFDTTVKNVSEKHGSGCVLSASIVTYLALENSLPVAIEKAKKYTSEFLMSNASLLGYHHFNSANGFKPGTISQVPLKNALNIDSQKQGSYPLVENNNNPRMHSLYYISQGKTLTDHVLNCKKACDYGIKMIQLRLKKESEENFLKAAIEIKAYCDLKNATLIINDNVVIAKKVESGLHLGKKDMLPSKARDVLGNNSLIGGTANTLEDVLFLLDEKVDYIGLGPYRFTTTKENLSPILGLNGYKKILSELHKLALSIPIYAIGGIIKDDIDPLLKIGVSGIAFSGLLNEISTEEIIEITSLS